MTWLKTEHFMLLTFWRWRFGKFQYNNLLKKTTVTRYWFGFIVFEMEQQK